MIATAVRLSALNTSGIANAYDPLEVLRWSAMLDAPTVLHTVEEVLRGAELSAATSARPTLYAREVVVAAQQAKRKVAIVSNNSSPAIAAYLSNNGLSRYVAAIVGRPCGAPQQMKPAPDLLNQAIDELGATPADCLFVGDSPSDIAAGHAAGVPVIGYANKPEKTTRLSAADAVITSIETLWRTMFGPQASRSNRD